MKIQRREFIIKSGVGVAAISTLPSTTLGSGLISTGKGSDDIIRQLSQLNDKDIPDLLKRQINDAGNRWDGGIADVWEVPHVHATKEFISSVGTAYVSKFSQYYLLPELEKALERAAVCLVNIQHEDGTIDLHMTNFRSPPDTAFIVNDLCPIYACLKRLNKSGLEQTITSLSTFIENTGKCLLVGGVHTANHRWVISSALAWVNYFFPSQKYVKRIDEWLSEGIDFDTDGQYSEKSVGAYSPICDNMFTVIGRLLDRPELQEYARKNLDMTMYYIQPGGEVVTDASGRQDRAYQSFVDQYYYAYRYFAIKDNNSEFAAVCKLIEREMPEKILKRIIRYASFILEDAIFEKDMPDGSSIPDNYFKRFSYSGVFRIRRGTTDISVIENNPTFFTFRKGNAVMQSLRLGAAFFGSRGQFISESSTMDGNIIKLSKSKTRGYMQTIPEKDRNGEVIWNDASRAARKEDGIQSMLFNVEIIENKGKVTIDIEVTGTEFVPVALEMSFRGGGELKGVVADKINQNSHFLEKNRGQYVVGDDVISFGPGCTAHKWSQLRGMTTKQDGHSVYLTGFTPFKHKLEIY